METIKSLADLMSRAQSETLYVRWEVSGAKGIGRGYSINHVTGGREAGISANSLMTDSLEWLACSVVEYRGVCGNTGWVIAGDEVGRGSDNEPILANVRIVGKVGSGLAEEAEATNRARQDRMFAVRGWTFTA